MAEETLINPKSYPVWEKLDRAQKYRMEKFANGCFDIGIDDPEEVQIETHQHLAVAYYWLAHVLRNNSEAYALAFDLFRQNLRRILRHTEAET